MMMNINQLEQELSERNFKHRTWFKEGKDTATALKLLATSLSGAWIEQKEIKTKGEIQLFSTPNYEYIKRIDSSRH